MAKWRIVTDAYAGYEVQHKYWWLPFWLQTDWVNTHSTVEQAERFAKGRARKVVKDLGYIA